jgi:hypothetical protein
MRSLKLALIPLLSACYVDVYDPGPAPGPQNAAPYISWADAGCWWDPQSRDYVWSFEAEANDADGVYDVVEVYADVYDTANGVWQDGFVLWDSSDPAYWYSDWYGSSTYLWCDYPGYVVDITAVDSFGDAAIVSVNPYRML